MALKFEKKDNNMSLTFTALPVLEGDAFLLQDNGKDYLFDAGGNQSSIANFLQKENVTMLDVAICSHNDSDHANGFKGLLNPKKNKGIQINELWLPGTWAKIIQFVIDNILNSKKWAIVDCALCNPGCDVKCELDRPNYDSYKDYIETPNLNAHLSDFSYLYDKYIIWSRHTKPSYLKLMLDNIMDIAKLAYNDGRTIRWFEHIDGCVSRAIDYGFVALNSREVLKIKKIDAVSVFIKTLLLTIENECSLVFEYHKNDMPVVRFSADSDCECPNKPYNNSIIITAPHHGSKNNIKAYNLDNAHAIWVRTHHREVDKPCDEFLRRKNKYCLRCIKLGLLQRICFEFDGTCWNYKRNQNTKQYSVCKCIP